jgi:hypothetical protein
VYILEKKYTLITRNNIKVLKNFSIVHRVFK